jgi:hypothetical protein
MTAILQRPVDEATPPVASRRPGRLGRASPSHRTVRLYVVDVVIAIAVVLLLDLPLTGLVVHEWLGLAIGVGLTTHLVQHAGWIWSTTRRIVGATSVRNRINYLMMIVLFASFLTAAWSGVMISEIALPAVGVSLVENPFWTWLHLVSVQVVLWVTAIHVALNWKWITGTTGRLFGRRRTAMEVDA